MKHVSAALHAGTKSRPLYRPITPDPDARAHLIVTDGRILPAELRSAFVGTEFRIWSGELAALATHLAAETTGLRLYVVGGEAFLWDVHRIAEAAGLGEGEILLHPPSDSARRVQCIHCKTITEGVTTPKLECSGCRLDLLVRDHFSRRLGAFQGVARHGVTRGEARP